ARAGRTDSTDVAATHHAAAELPVGLVRRTERSGTDPEYPYVADRAREESRAAVRRARRAGARRRRRRRVLRDARWQQRAEREQAGSVEHGRQRLAASVGE